MTKEQEVTNALYVAYGSDSGYLLGLEPKYRDIIEVIVRFALEFKKGEE